ncbi:hypothetical protein Scep_029982 [Stephania cephalantha]|uniref:Uncharacterized protein n=1 Tax=Stephania cephalantha TaxID=152367 RepID=A0AAP0DYY0_9MAGN
MATDSQPEPYLGLPDLGRGLEHAVFFTNLHLRSTVLISLTVGCYQILDGGERGSWRMLEEDSRVEEFRNQLQIYEPLALVMALHSLIS